ncbi:hypothetical protein ATCC90586_003194 [Pythium insidiosum]|nr:hypothetical protein ATCC90586_003194 [Pythium insidiosum]
MPPSEKKKLRASVSRLLLQRVLLTQIHDWDDWFVPDTDADELVRLGAGLVSCRYLNPRISPVTPPATQHQVLQMKDNEFYQSVRMCKPTFCFIATLIRDDRVFHNKSNRAQRDPTLQLAVALEWYGHYGNANAVGKIAQAYCIGAGTVTLYVRRVQKALLRHYQRFVRWPSRARRLESSAYHRERYGLEGCVGFVDGTHVIFAQKPHIDGGLHYNRKSRYSLNVQVVCDEDKRILMAFTGWPGSCNDSTVFARMPLATEPGHYFDGDQYLIGDTGYALSSRLIVPFKRPASERPGNTRFNEVISSSRVVNENSIGLLKNRWMSLKGVRTQIKKKEDFRTVNNQVLTCVMLHNIGLILKDLWGDEVRDDTDNELMALTAEDNEDGNCGVTKREQLKIAVLGRSF